MTTSAIDSWRRHLNPIQAVSSKPPEWVLPGLLVPGMVLLAGDPKTYKSFLALTMTAALTAGRSCAAARIKAPAKQGTCLYFAAEQSPASVRHIYETRVLKQRLPAAKNWDFALVKNPWDWQIDEPQGELQIEELIGDLRPTLTVLDPLVYFHSIEENDPALVRPLVPLRQAVAAYGGTLLVVHHARKLSANASAAAEGFSRVRGTSALWAMADGGIMLTRNKGGTINITTDFKDYTGSTWTWRPG